MWNIVKYITMYIIGIPKGEESKEGAEKTLKKLSEIFSDY